MTFTLIDSITAAGNPAKANDDAWMAGAMLAAVIDGATSLNDPIMPGSSDAAWLAHLAAERLTMHDSRGDSLKALRATVTDIEDQFLRQRSRPPIAMHEMPCASMMLLQVNDHTVDALWFGDCSAILCHPCGDVIVVGDALDKRLMEASQVAALAAKQGVSTASTTTRAEFLPALRESRDRYNNGDGAWLLTPDPDCVDRAKCASFTVDKDTLILLASDGFTALITDYAVYDAAGLVAAAIEKGLAALLAELRAIEAQDPDGAKFARYKKSDDATAVLIRI
jgi:serine/threonine protein phosphatase PrpC